MTLLFITRKIDKQDSRAGFVSEWVKKFAERLDKLIIICQEKGDISDLPSNIEIYSFGKSNKFKQLYKYKLLLWKHIRRTDGVFAHMMPIYSIIAGPFCKILKKRLFHWYTHKSVDLKLKLANIFVDGFITASKQSFRLKTKKPIHILGHGINIDVFKPNPENKKTDIFNILTAGRISPTKDYESMIKAVYELNQKNIKLIIVGGIGLASQQSYLDTLKTMVVNMKLENQVEFTGPIPHLKTLDYLQSADLFINLSNTGSLDKAVLHAMSTATIPITSNEAFEPILPQEFIAPKDNPKALAEKIKQIINWPEDKKQELGKKLRQIVVDNHNLDKLVEKIINIYK